MASSKKWQTAKYKQAVSKAQAKAAGWVYSKRKIASEDIAIFGLLEKNFFMESLHAIRKKRKERKESKRELR